MTVAVPDGSVPVAFKTLGCKVNRAESDSIAAELLGRGVHLADERDAAVIVINTCTVTGEADAKARKAVRHALGAQARPIVVVTGCLAAVDPQALQSLGERVIVESDKARVAARVAELLRLASDDTGRVARRLRSGAGFRSRASLKIEDGCDNFCTYCIVPYARGVPRAVPLARVAAEARELVDAGIRELVLTGINLGRYACPQSGADLARVVEAVAATGIARLRLSSIEPPDLTQDLLGVLSDTPAVCEHLHVPLQSGSDRVLSAMGRHYTAEEYARRIEAAREALPGLAITADVIAGFPGESDADHAETIAFVERIGFSKLHVFRYSERAGTPAALLAQLPAPTRAARAADLRRLGDALRTRYIAERMPRRAEVLVESAADGYATGTTRDYVRVRVRDEQAAPGDVRTYDLTTEDVILG